MLREPEFILTLSCCGATGIFCTVSGPRYQGGCTSNDSQQFGMQLPLQPVAQRARVRMIGPNSVIFR